jgi:hypothetical protein
MMLLHVKRVFRMLPTCAAMMLMSCTGKTPDKKAPATAGGQEYVEAVPVPKEAADAPVVVADDIVPFRTGGVRAKGDAIEVLDAAGNVIAVNQHLIRDADEESDCPSGGFNRIVAKGDYFTIEQQTCSGMFFIDEYITFKAAADGQVYLHKFSIVKTNRSDPEAAIPQRTLSVKEFGKLELEQVDLSNLYPLFE